jgi:hypothetical protein
MAPESERPNDKACLCYCCEGNLRELCPDWNWAEYPTQRGWCRRCFTEILRTRDLAQEYWHDCKPKLATPPVDAVVDRLLNECVGGHDAWIDRVKAQRILSEWLGGKIEEKP